MINKQRSYICFVCFESFDNLEGFRSHITNNHEEGTDYIICPECKTPLRELKKHYAIKHPDKTIPKDYPIRPIILRDAIAKRPKKIPKFKTGFFFSKKNNKELYFRSGLECQFYQVLEKRKDILKYSVEPIEIDYIFEGYGHKYIPDILVEYATGKMQLWEIKPKNQTKLPKNLAKWSAASSYCKKRNWDFIILTEKGLRILKEGKNII